MLSIVEQDFGTPERESAKLVTLTIDGARGHGAGRAPR